MARRNPRGWLRSGSLAAISTAALLLATSHLAQAKITRIVINSTTSPAFNGQSFGSVGQYEQLNGTAYGEVDPSDPLNSIIQDINLAPRNANGNVEYSMDIEILRPIDAKKGNHVLLYDVVNRGSQLAPGTFNVGITTASPAGDGFLENQGYTIVWSGWQGDLVKTPTNFAMTVPIAYQNRNPNQPITGIVRSEISMLTASEPGSPIFGAFATSSVGYPPVSFDTSKATLTERVHEEDPRVPIPSSQWSFATCNATTPFPGTPDTYGMAQYQICLQGGFDPNHIYELIYEAKDPLVLGLGFASTRDFVSYLHHSSDKANPVAGTIDNTLIFGASQSGRYIRTFLDLGFNEDENNRIVFQGMQPHIATARIAMNIRFGQPGRGSGLQHVEHGYPGLESPMTWGIYDDPIANVTGGILQRCKETKTCPKITQSVSSIEYWQSAMSSDTTDDFGLHDLTIPNDVRIYHFASTQHGGYSPIGPVPPVATPVCEQLPNANSYTYNIRAVLVALTKWVVNGTSPPASRYARLSNGSLVRTEQLDFPFIPNVYEDVGDLLDQRTLYYRGPKFDGFNMSGIITVEPPLPLFNYLVLVPQVDADGNDIDGVRSITLRAPLGTYTGWNTRAAGFGQGDACDLTGSFIPFAATDAQRTPGDTRPSLQDRYGNAAGYAAAVTAAANALVREGFLLPQDKAVAISEAEAQASGLLP